MGRRWSRMTIWLGLRSHELLGLLLQFLGITSIGIGMYFCMWFAVRPLFYRSLVFSVNMGEWLLFPFFFGIGGVLWALGSIELRSALPLQQARQALKAEGFLHKKKK